MGWMDRWRARCASTTPVLVVGLLVVALGGCKKGSPGTDYVEPEVQQARALASSNLSKQAGIFPVQSVFGDEAFILAQQDLQVASSVGFWVLPQRFTNTLNRLNARASVAPTDTRVVSDMACTQVGFGGGVAGDRVIHLDGKLLDLMAEVSNALALIDSGRLTATLTQVVDAAAAQQMNFSNFCRAADPIAFPDSALSLAEQDRAVEYFTQLVGGIYFHEFGHVWGWHSLARIRDQYLAPQGSFFSYTSVIEDNADLTSGILNAKAGHSASVTKLMIDLMAFQYFYRRNPGFVSFANVQGWSVQYQQTSPTHSSLAGRKGTIDVGYSAWARR